MKIDFKQWADFDDFHINLQQLTYKKQQQLFLWVAAQKKFLESQTQQVICWFPDLETLKISHNPVKKNVDLSLFNGAWKPNISGHHLRLAENKLSLLEELSGWSRAQPNQLPFEEQESGHLKIHKQLNLA